MTTDDMPSERGWLAAACRGLEIVTMWLLGAITVLVLAQIAARDVFGVGAPWAEELARYCGLSLVYLALPLLLLNDKHIHVDMLVKRLHGLPQRVVLVANEAFTVLFCALFLWGGWVFMQRASKFSTPAIGMPNWLYYLPAFVGMLVFTLVALRRLARVFGGKPAAGEAP
jgi:TRAP-type C4-dicarboxylate transport system permease small subunit